MCQAQRELEEAQAAERAHQVPLCSFEAEECALCIFGHAFKRVLLFSPQEAVMTAQREAEEARAAQAQAQKVRTDPDLSPSSALLHRVP